MEFFLFASQHTILSARNAKALLHTYFLVCWLVQCFSLLIIDYSY